MKMFKKKRKSQCGWKITFCMQILWGSLCSWSCGNWIYNYLCNQCLPPLKWWVRIPLMKRCTSYNFMRSSLSATCDRSMVFSYTPVPLLIKTDRNDISEILLKVTFNNIILNLTLFFLMLCIWKLCIQCGFPNIKLHLYMQYYYSYQK